ncbi:MAG: patatin-like phospholipase family protein [Actinobacteria bacterium]|nr:patatin-like phospholipase family protein [Actinomycetota bacterium]
MTRVGLVLGGGGITGAAYEMAALLALELATGWNPNDADVLVGTSSGSFVGSLLRHDALTVDSLVMPEDERADVAERIRSHVHTRGRGPGIGKWLRHGVVPGLRRPGLTMLLGTPAPYHASGLAAWVTTQIGEEAAGGWPERSTAIVAYDVRRSARVGFGTANAPVVGIADAVAASSAVPLFFAPYEIDGDLYVDGGVVSGTNADLVLASPEPLDFVLVIAPMAAALQRRRARFHEAMFDRIGLKALDAELRAVSERWPHCETLVLSPSPSVQNAMRPNPMSSARAVGTFMRTLIAMKRTLAQPEVWALLRRHIAADGLNPSAVAR